MKILCYNIVMREIVISIPEISLFFGSFDLKFRVHKPQMSTKCPHPLERVDTFLLCGNIF